MNKTVLFGMSIALSSVLLFQTAFAATKSDSEDDTIVMVQTYETSDSTETREGLFEDELEGGYELKLLEYSIQEEIKETEEKVISETYVTKDLLEKEEAPLTMKYEYEKGNKLYQIVTLSVLSSEFKDQKILLGNEGKDTVTATYEVHGDATAPMTMDVEYTDQKTGATVTVTIPKERTEQTGTEKLEKDVTVTFYDYDAPSFLFDGVKIKNDKGSVPPISGYESLFLGHVDLADAEIISYEWDGEAYESNGELCRNAKITVSYSSPVYTAYYGGDDIELPTIDGFERTDVYEATITEETGNITYIMKAQATYEKASIETKGITPLQASLVTAGGIIALGAGVILILNSVRKNREKKGSA